VAVKTASGRPARAKVASWSASAEPCRGGVHARLPAAGIWEGVSIVKGRYYTGAWLPIFELESAHEA